MRAPRWALALSALAIAGSDAFVISLPASASESGRIEVSARGDAMYFEGNSPSIPASPTNDASSLYAVAESSSSGGGTATASTPYFGSTLQNLPGTANGVPPQFGSDLAFPFTRLPGYITCRDSGEDNAEFHYGRVSIKCGQGTSEAHGSQGAPPAIPAPNQQETADAVTRIEDGTAVAEAVGTVKGFVAGPLEVGNAIATATIRAAGGKEPEIKSSTSGTFSVGDQRFGFTENGITFAGQEASQQDALKQADEALKAAGIQIEVAPVTKSVDTVSGQTSYTIGGLKITWTQQDSQLVFILCRASIAAVNESLGGSSLLDAITTEEPSPTTDSTGTTIESGSSTSVAPGTGANDGTVSADSGLTGATLTSRTALTGSGFSNTAHDSTSDFTATPSLETPEPLSEETLASPAVGPKTLGGLRPAGHEVGKGSGWLYLLIVIGGIVVFGGQAALSRFAGTRG
jgi:hypothetical protein